MWNTFAVVLYKTEGRERVSFLFYLAFLVFFVSLVPIIFMAVVYCKISRALIQQEKYMNRVFSYEMRRRAPASSLIS